MEIFGKHEKRVHQEFHWVLSSIQLIVYFLNWRRHTISCMRIYRKSRKRSSTSPAFAKI